jgi:hypothetical protein
MSPVDNRKIYDDNWAQSLGPGETLVCAWRDRILRARSA